MIKLKLNYVIKSCKQFIDSDIIFSTGNGGGSGGRICVYISEQLRFLGVLTALGGSSSASHGSPGTVWVNSTVGSDTVTNLWVDHASRGSGCTSYPVYVDVSTINNFHPLRTACVHPSVVSLIISSSDLESFIKYT